MSKPIKHIPGPEGVRGRNSDNALILEKLGWAPSVSLRDGLRVRARLQRGGAGTLRRGWQGCCCWLTPPPNPPTPQPTLTPPSDYVSLDQG